MTETGLKKKGVCVTEETRQLTGELFDFIDASPTAFHAVAQAVEWLEAAGYTQVMPGRQEGISKGGRYYARKNDSALVAFRIPGRDAAGFHIAASHSDSPCFKVKESPEMKLEGSYTKLNTEMYGGLILSSWLDRALSIAGRVIVEEEGELVSRLVDFDRDLLVIPNVAIHFNREINKGMIYNPQIDMLPLFAAGSEQEKTLHEMCAEELRVDREQILASDLYVYNRDKGRQLGAGGEFIGSPRLDDLQCVFAAWKGFLEAEGQDTEACDYNDDGADIFIPVCVVFDNEEIGSGTKQGADSTFLTDTLDAVMDSLGWDGGQRRAALDRSFLLSADNAHAVHPNHPELSDPTNRPVLNGGVVLKFQGSQKYTTDAQSAAVVRRLCRKAGVPCQNFANKSDISGGSTLGNISSAHLSIPAADIGLAQLAMHSAFETAGVKDTEYMVRLCKAFFV